MWEPQLISTAGRKALALLVATLLVPVAGLAQGAPPPPGTPPSSDDYELVQTVSTDEFPLDGSGIFSAMNDFLENQFAGGLGWKGKQGGGTALDDKSATYTYTSPDGETIVFGRIQGRRIVIQVFKRKKKLVTPQGAAQVGTPAPAQSPAQPQSPSTGSGATKQIGQPLPPAAVRAFELNFVDDLDKQVGQIQIDRVSPVGGKGGLGGGPVPQSVIRALVLTRNVAVEDFQARIDWLNQVNGSALTRQLEKLALEANSLYDNMNSQFSRATGKDQSWYRRLLEHADELETLDRENPGFVHKWAERTAQELREDAKMTPYGWALHLRTRLADFLRKNPLLALQKDGQFLFQALVNTRTDTPGPVVAKIFNSFIDASRQTAYDEKKKAQGIHTLSELWQYGMPRYYDQQIKASQIGQALGAQLPQLHISELQAVFEGYRITQEEEDAFWNSVKGGALGTVGALSILVPGGPLIALGVSAIQVYLDGSELVITYLDEQAARNTSGITGAIHVLTAEERTAAQKGQLLLSLGSLGIDAFGVKSMKFLRRTGKAAEEVAEAVGAERGGSRLSSEARAAEVAAKAVEEGGTALIPAGTKPVVRDVTDANAILKRIDTTVFSEASQGVKRTPFGGITPGDASFFRGQGLAPQKTVEIGGHTFHLSPPFEGPGGRLAVVAFQETGDGKVIPRTLYLSNEHAVWRVAVGRGDLLEKGPKKIVDRPDMPRAREIPIQEYEKDLVAREPKYPSAESMFVNESSVDVAAELQGTLSRWVNEKGVTKIADAKAADRAFYGHVEQTYGPYSAREFGAHVTRPDAEIPFTQRNLAGGGAPDFKAGPLEHWTIDTPEYGRVDGFLYRSQDGRELFVVLRGTTKEGKTVVFVPSIQDGGATLTPFGTRANAYKTDLSATPRVHNPEEFAPKPYIDNPGGFQNDLNRAFEQALPQFPGATGAASAFSAAKIEGIVGEVRAAVARTGNAPTGLVKDFVDTLPDAIRKASAAGVTESTIDAAVARARATGTVSAWTTNLFKELQVAEVNAQGGTVLVNPGRRPVAPPNATRGVREALAEEKDLGYLEDLQAWLPPGVAPNAIVPIDTVELGDIAIRVRLIAKDSANAAAMGIEFTDRQLAILAQGLLPRGEAVTKLVILNAEEGKFTRIFDPQFVKDLDSGTWLKQISPEQWARLRATNPSVYDALQKAYEARTAGGLNRTIAGGSAAAAAAKDASATPGESTSGTGRGGSNAATPPCPEKKPLLPRAEDGDDWFERYKLLLIVRETAGPEELASAEGELPSWLTDLKLEDLTDVDRQNLIDQLQKDQAAKRELGGRGAEDSIRAFERIIEKLKASRPRAGNDCPPPQNNLKAGDGGAPSGKPGNQPGGANPPGGAKAAAGGEGNVATPPCPERKPLLPRAEGGDDWFERYKLLLIVREVGSPDELASDEGRLPSWLTDLKPEDLTNTDRQNLIDQLQKDQAAKRELGGQGAEDSIRAFERIIEKLKASRPRAGNDCPPPQNNLKAGDGGAPGGTAGNQPCSPGRTCGTHEFNRGPEDLLKPTLPEGYTATRNADGSYTITGPDGKTYRAYRDAKGETQIEEVPTPKSAGAGTGATGGSGSVVYEGPYGGGRPGDVFAADQMVRGVIRQDGFDPDSFKHDWKTGGWTMTSPDGKTIYEAQWTKGGNEISVTKRTVAAAGAKAGGKTSMMPETRGSGSAENTAGAGGPTESDSACSDSSNGLCEDTSRCVAADGCMSIDDCTSNPSLCTTSTDTETIFQIVITARASRTAGGGRTDNEGRGERTGSHHVLARVGHAFFGWLAALDRRPRARAYADITALAPGTLVWLAEPGSATTRRSSSSGPLVSLVANGASSGEAFEVRVLDPTGRISKVAIPEGVVLQPVKGGPAAPPQRGPDMVRRQPLGAYCLEFAKLPPAPGMLYRVADQALQKKFRPLKYLLQVGRRLAAKGLLHPDSDPASYADAIKQYALWTKLENWDLKKFGEAFVERTKKNVLALKRGWTKEMEAAVKAAIPGRWRDITLVLDEAAALASKSQAPAEGPTEGR